MRYLVRHKHGMIDLGDRPHTSRMDMASRRRQIAELNHALVGAPVVRELRHWMSSQQGTVRSAIEVMTPDHTLMPGESPPLVGLTGWAVLDMNKAQAELLARAIPGLTVIPDFPIALVEPVRSPGTVCATASAVDLWHLGAIGLTAARAKGFTGDGSGVIAAVLDTGVQPVDEIAGRLVAAYTFNDLGRPVAQTPGADTQGHGTHVAGLFCGRTVGVAPGARIVSYVMLPGGYGTASNFIAGLEAAAADPRIAIVNMSAGLRDYHPELASATAGVVAAGLLPAFAVGNRGQGRSISPGNFASVLSIGATDTGNAVWDLSSSETVTGEGPVYSVPKLVAPGVGVYSCTMDGGYAPQDGTSEATAIVAGLAALVLQRTPQTTVNDLMTTLIRACAPLNALAGRAGNGLAQLPGGVTG